MESVVVSDALFLPLPPPPPAGIAPASFSAAAAAAAAALVGRPRRLTGDASIPASVTSFWVGSSWNTPSKKLKENMAAGGEVRGGFCASLPSSLLSWWPGSRCSPVLDFLTSRCCCCVKTKQMKHCYSLLCSVSKQMLCVCVCIPVFVVSCDQWRRVGAGVTGRVWSCSGLLDDPPTRNGQSFVDSRQNWSWFGLSKKISQYI